MEIKLTICQHKVINNKNKNLTQAEEMITQAANQGADFVVLPEMFNCPYDNKYFPKFAEEVPGTTSQFLGKIANQHNIYLIGGSIPELVITSEEQDKLYNTSLIFSPSGELLAKHRKLHLFDVDLSNGVTFLESDTLDYGEQITVVNTDKINFGVAICYDLRFPELMKLMVKQGAEMIIIPGAFNTVTGPAHWETLLTARAIDNQVFMAGASPARNFEADYQAYGHSMILDPWGRKLEEADINKSLISCEIDITKLNKVRQELPLLTHQREDLYQL